MPHPPNYFEDKFGMTIHQRARELMEKERREHPEKTWWYLSYAHETKGFMGGAIVEGYGFVWACNNARIMGITPGPDVETRGIQIPPDEVPKEMYRNRLLTKDELNSFWKMASLAELEGDHAE
jgi:hypothetical protein